MMQGFLIFLVSLMVGAFGSMLGIGGGVLLIPLLTGLFDMPIKTAIGASIVSVIATSSAAGAVYVGRGLAHTRLSMVLEIATTTGALAGGITAVLVSPHLLEGAFAALLVYVAFTLRRISIQEGSIAPTGLLDTTYTNPLNGQTVTYGVRNLPQGMGASFLAGNISGLLGIGCGIIKVPIMNLVMGVPLRAAIATSNFMIGITAATSAVVYYQHGYLDPRIAIPTSLGVLIGAQAGTRIGGRVRSLRLKQLFQWLVLIFAAQMLYKAVRG
ncbi:MAG TPA: sulfite exporter TauE/SafE family protein [Pyrinomonadaceae bacterium]|nr:sulfite exporter TauE/SafE family protein [Pyrinomonadaceae bacterium]